LFAGGDQLEDSVFGDGQFDGVGLTGSTADETLGTQTEPTADLWLGGQTEATADLGLGGQTATTITVSEAVTTGIQPTLGTIAGQETATTQLTQPTTASQTTGQPTTTALSGRPGRSTPRPRTPEFGGDGNSDDDEARFGLEASDDLFDSGILSGEDALESFGSPQFRL